MEYRGVPQGRKLEDLEVKSLRSKFKTLDPADPEINLSYTTITTKTKGVALVVSNDYAASHLDSTDYGIDYRGLSLEFCSGKICSGGTKFSLKILVPGTKFSENFVPSLKKLFHN